MSCKFYGKNGNTTTIVICVIAFDPIRIFIDWAHQNDRQNLSFVRAINVVGEKMTGNGRKSGYVVRKFGEQPLGYSAEICTLDCDSTNFKKIPSNQCLSKIELAQNFC